MYADHHTRASCLLCRRPRDALAIGECDGGEVAPRWRRARQSAWRNVHSRSTRYDHQGGPRMGLTGWSAPPGRVALHAVIIMWRRARSRRAPAAPARAVQPVRWLLGDASFDLAEESACGEE